MYYHFTKNNFVNVILRTGLNINSGQGGFGEDKIDFYLEQFGLQQLFLTTDPDKVARTMLGGAIRNFTLLSIRGGLIVAKERYFMVYERPWLAPWDGHSYIYFYDISASVIERV